MADKSDFTPEEWKLLLGSVMMAGIAVTVSEPSGLWGLLKESFAGGSALAQARIDVGTNALVDALVSDLETAQGRIAARDGLKESLAQSSPTEVKANCIKALRHAAILVEVKCADDAPAFKAWLHRISWHVAEVAREDACHGSATAAVSAAEQATLGEIASALELAASEPQRPEDWTATRKSSRTLPNGIGTGS